MISNQRVLDGDDDPYYDEEEAELEAQMQKAIDDMKRVMPGAKACMVCVLGVGVCTGHQPSLTVQLPLQWS